MTATTIVPPSPKTPALEFFGMILSSLPPVGLAPSKENPYVSPLPLSMGIDHDPKTKCTSLHLVHATRENEYVPGQKPVFKPLSKICSFSTTGDVVFKPNLDIKEIAEFMPQLESKSLVKEIPDALGTWVVQIDKTKMSKKCGWCNRWEQMTRDSQGRLKYRRWKLCQGCYAVWFCRPECSDRAWLDGHWETCLVANNEGKTYEAEESLLQFGKRQI